jgi:hypothetical protein
VLLDIIVQQQYRVYQFLSKQICTYILSCSNSVWTIEDQTQSSSMWSYANEGTFQVIRMDMSGTSKFWSRSRREKKFWSQSRRKEILVPVPVKKRNLVPGPGPKARVIHALRPFVSSNL